MGFALARAARARGAEVTLLAANVALDRPPGIACRQVVTAAELEQACEEEFASCDVLLMAAAVADFRPSAPTDGKIKKSGRARLELELEPTTDVLAGLARRRRDGQTLVGFAAEYGDRAVEAGREKLTAKGLDAIVVNDISRADIGFDVDSNEVTILTSNGGESGSGGPSQEQPAKPPARASAGGPPAPGSLPASVPADLHLARAGKDEIAEAILDAVERLRTGR
jgi:phosphopantothenoylcysteine decarboxylase/phosphopantothenate--cysteine ligase